ncbi:MAG: anthranilate phosphoribosyltransferase [Gemmatimonadetes bacterium]|nr:anthranilate phosphoribosyltransferase [Gemmatimonadota bacterium]
MADSPLHAAIRRVVRSESLSFDETTAAFSQVMAGDGTPVLVAALLAALRVKGESADEVAGAAAALRAAMSAVELPEPGTLVDTCGTGGGAVQTFNISTAAAFVAAGAGVRVAKHGNRSFTTKCGSADVLEALGVSLEIPPRAFAGTLQAAGMVFMFAPAMHPAMRHVGPVRRELGIETLMNYVGPLANPARAARQVVGVSDPRRAELMAGALQRLGTAHALVVYGEPGMDEFSPLGPTHVIEVRDGMQTKWVADPVALGVAAGSPAELAGGMPKENADLVHRILAGNHPGGAENAVLLNAGAAVYVAGLAPDLAGGIVRARESVRTGRARQALESLVSTTRAAAAAP